MQKPMDRRAAHRLLHSSAARPVSHKLHSTTATIHFRLNATMGIFRVKATSRLFKVNATEVLHLIWKLSVKNNTVT